MNSQGYEEVEHIADLAIRVWGGDFHAILTASAQGMYALMGILLDITKPYDSSFNIKVEAREIILVDFLTEILYFCEYQKTAFDTFEFFNDGEVLRVNARGSEVKKIERNIKAVTFHDLKIIPSTKGLETTIIFDV